MRVLFAVLFLVAFGAHNVSAAETITSFHSDIRVGQDGVLTVTETISVIAEGDQIRRGIYRDFPTVRGRTWWGAFRVSFEVEDVTRDGSPEPWFTQGIPDGVRVYIGNPERNVARGPHTYSITYRSDRQVGFLEDHDELYWNVTGNFWSFPIEKASATIHLPPGATILDTQAFTGRVGSEKSEATFGFNADGAHVTATRPLSPGEGLTFRVSCPKGIVSEPTAFESLRYAVRDNAGVLVGLVGLIAVFGFYLLAWSRYGRDPSTGTIVAEYDAPNNLSPAACRYILNMGWDQKTFSAALVSMAAKGYMTMDQESKKEFSLTRGDSSEDQAKLSPGERAAAHKLFSRPSQTIVLKQSARHTITAAMKALQKALEREHDLVHFIANSGLLWTGGGLSLAVMAGMVFASPDRPPVDMILGGLAGLIAILVYLGIKTLLGTIRDGGIGRRIVSVMVLTAALSFGGQFVAIFFESVSSAASNGLSGLLSLGTLTVAALAVINLIFFEIMKAPTVMGRRLMDRIEGLKLYLTVAEKDRLNFHNPPELTPERFEAYLPYAIALDVENEWGEQFHAAMARAAAERGGAWHDNAYRPRWYSGRHYSGVSSLAALGSTLTSSVATASAPPSSSSGGGGFSGGGGGGGGGGGW